MKDQIRTYNFDGTVVPFHLNQSVSTYLQQASEYLLITDTYVAMAWPQLFTNKPCIIVKPGEISKTQTVVTDILEAMLNQKISKTAHIIAIGGGVITDLAGYIAAIYKRGLRITLVPSSILAMVDAAIGGKNGINAGMYKNVIGTIHQPEAILYDYNLLQTLPQDEWVNGFAEIIKHACIRDNALFESLQQYSITYYMQNETALSELIEKNIEIKTAIVSEDTHEHGIRRALNFGHTLGHAIEQQYNLPHGQAISIGMMAACKISEKLSGFSSEETAKVKALLEQYGLATHFDYDPEKVWESIVNDKKVSGTDIHFVLLKKIGEVDIQKIPVEVLKNLLWNE